MSFLGSKGFFEPAHLVVKLHPCTQLSATATLHTQPVVNPQSHFWGYGRMSIEHTSQGGTNYP